MANPITRFTSKAGAKQSTKIAVSSKQIVPRIY
jgi:hypothetical protein